MHSGVLLFLTAVITYVTAQNVPAGFIPLPPLPVQTVKPTFKPKVTPKSTQAPITKKPVKTKAPFKPTTTKPTLPPTTSQPPSTHVATSQQASITKPKPSCGLNINLPNANCKGGNSAVQQTLNTLKQELDRTRQQHQAQNAAVQSMITKLQTQQSGYVNKISDLQNEVRNLVTAFNSLSASKPISTAAPGTVAPPITGIPNSFLQQAVQNVRQDMNQAVRDFNNKVFNLSSLLISDQQQDMKAHQSIESQIQQQANEIGRLSQLVRQLNTTTSSGGTGATSADVAKLQDQIKNVTTVLRQYDQSQQGQISSLNLKTSSLQAEVSNHTNQMRGLQTSLILDQSRVNKVDKDITVVHDALAQFRKSTLPKINQIESDVQSLTSNMSSVQSGVTNVRSTVFKLIIQLGQDSAKLTSLEGQTTQLKKQVSNIQSDLGSQSKEIQAIQGGITSLKNAIPISDLNKMNNNILQVLADLTNGKNPSKQQLQDLTKSITTITAKLASLNATSSPSG